MWSWKEWLSDSISAAILFGSGVFWGVCYGAPIRAWFERKIAKFDKANQCDSCGKRQGFNPDCEECQKDALDRQAY